MNERDIEERINEVRRAWLLDRMPSRSEVEAYYGNSSLSNAISKSGGFYHWAEKLGLEIKKSETKLGYDIEVLAMKLLEDKGYSCEKTSVCFPYDLLVNGSVKVDVKAARVSKVRTTDVYSFRLAKPQQTCDVYVAMCLDEDDKPMKVYVIPAHIMHGKKQLALGVGHSVYDKYLNRWEIIEELTKSFERLA